MKQRSIGVTVFGWLSILYGCLLSALGVYLFVYLPKEIAGPPPDYADAVLMTRIASVFSLALGFIYLVSGGGVLLLKKWARVLTIVNAGIITIWKLGAVAGSIGRFQSWREALPVLLACGWNGLLLWYFLRPAVKAQFVSKTTNR